MVNWVQFHNSAIKYIINPGIVAFDHLLHKSTVYSNFLVHTRTQTIINKKINSHYWSLSKYLQTHQVGSFWLSSTAW